MDEQLNSIVKQLNRLAQKQTGLNPKAKTIERALKTFVDAYSGGGAGGDSIWGNIIGSIENQTDLIDKIDSMIDDELANFEHVSYKIADSIPTPTEVVIGGETVPTEEGVRYLYKPTGATSYEEYVLIDGVIIDLGSSGDVNLDNYYNKTETDALLTGKADVSDLPTKTSDLTNDSLFVDKDTDQLTNYTKTTALNNALNLKADKSTTYTKDEVNTKLDLKADTDDIPTKTSDLTNDSGFITKSVNNLDNYTKTTDLNTALALKANATDIPTKTSDLTNDSGYIDANVNNLTNYTKTSDMNTALNSKADKLTTYTKTEVDTALLLKADKSNTYTKTEVDTLIDNAVAFSTEEKKVGTWVDGKPLYRKTYITTATIPNYNVDGQILSVPIGVSNIKQIFIERCLFFAENGTSFTIPSSLDPKNPSDTSVTSVDVDRDNINFICKNGGWGAIWTKVIIVNYTKTTD